MPTANCQVRFPCPHSSKPTARKLATFTSTTLWDSGLRWPTILKSPSTEYIFDVTSDRKTTFAVSIFLPPQALERWAAHRGRDLTEPEQYAGVKLRLLQGFDEIADMLRDGRRLRLDGELLIELLDSIGVD